MKYLQTFEGFKSGTLTKGAEIEIAKQEHDKLEKDLYIDELKEEEEKEAEEKDKDKKKKVA